MNLLAVTPYIDHWHVMTYDYTVSDVPGGETMSPNAPLYTPSAPAEQMSISYSIEGYMAEGVPPSKLMLGIPFYVCARRSHSTKHGELNVTPRA